MLACTVTMACDDADDLSADREGRLVVDGAGIVAEDSEARMGDLLGALLGEADVELVAASVPRLDDQTIEAAASELFERWEVGDRTNGGRGLLLLVAEDEERVRMEIGYGLEGTFTDAFVGYVEREQMVPYFAEGRVGEGFEATVELVAGRAFDRLATGAYDPGRDEPETISGFRTGGAGAQTDAPVGRSGGAKPAAGEATRSRFAAQPTPGLAWARFLESNRERIKDPDLGIYDAEARRFLRDRPITNAGQDHIVDLYGDETPTLRRRGDRAVVLFPDDPDHRLAPWFFHRTSEGWQLDGSVYPGLVRYNHRNQWRFARTDHPYTFAFEDFRIDRNGFATFDTAR